MNRPDLPTAIATLRGERTRTAFARALDVPRNYPKRWEDGTVPSTEHLQRLVGIGLDGWYLLGALATAKPNDADAA